MLKNKTQKDIHLKKEKTSADKSPKFRIIF
jgi:hypothetical protein